MDIEANVEFQEEFSLFYVTEFPRVVAFLVVLGARTAIAAEVAQEAMIEAYRKWADLDHPRAWIRVVARRNWLRLSEIEKREVLTEGDAFPLRLISVEDADAIDSQHTLLVLLANLTNDQRQVMAWTYDGYSSTEIAEIVGKTPATVRSLRRKARERLRQEQEPGEVTT